MVIMESMKVILLKDKDLSSSESYFLLGKSFYLYIPSYLFVKKCYPGGFKLNYIIL
jgi:hypothetical protein